MLAKEIGAFIQTLGNGLGGDEGFRWGSPDAEVSGVLVAWNGSVPAIERAAAEGCNLMVIHEELTYPYAFRGGDLSACLHWRSNQARLGRLARHGITIFRAHGTLDTYCILDDFRIALGLPEPSVKEGYYRICDIEPTTVRELAERSKAALRMPALRVAGDLDRVVRRVGLPWGGLGLSLNVSFLEGLLAYNPDVLIAGESDEYAMFAMLDADVPLIEMGHAVSENMGLERTAQTLRETFAGLKVVYHEVPCPWTMV
jgi:putative NIF3 family GTP cyclohydrolase 1 type 2